MIQSYLNQNGLSTRFIWVLNTSEIQIIKLEIHPYRQLKGGFLFKKISLDLSLKPCLFFCIDVTRRIFYNYLLADLFFCWEGDDWTVVPERKEPWIKSWSSGLTWHLVKGSRSVRFWSHLPHWCFSLFSENVQVTFFPLRIITWRCVIR